jgi:hypothetical protein
VKSCSRWASGFWIRSFTLGREESIAITSVAPDGGIYTASSPVRRAAGRALYPDLAEELVGGISRYKPVRNDLLARDASCAAGVRARNAATVADSALESAEQDIRQIQALIAQSRGALGRAVNDGDLDAGTAEDIDSELASTAEGLSVSGLDTAVNELLRVCNALDRDLVR